MRRLFGRRRQLPTTPAPGRTGPTASPDTDGSPSGDGGPVGGGLDRLLAAALDVVPAGVVIFDRDARVVARNAAATGLADARHGDALVAAAVDELLADALAGRVGRRELELFGPPRRVLRIEVAPAVEGTERIGAVALVRDVTEERRVEAVRRDFVANVSHELKTPVGAVSLLAETLVDAGDPAVVARLAGRLRDEALRLSAMVDDLLELSRVEAAATSEPTPVEVGEVVEQARRRVAETARQRGVDIEVRPVPADARVAGDRAQLVSAVFNLLDNAVKYSGAGSRVEVRVAVGGGRVAVAVQDEGIGIPAAARDRIFERFYRVDRARSRATGGTGLGLSIVRHVVTGHGGEVTVSSREGEGSTFSIVLPALDVPGGAGPGGDAGPTESAPARREGTA
ncbi:MAG: two-component sensor histidine kinase [Actinomyces sp.]|nr:MAG: two-component sensor histidine kinase [Actinomyces sp.]